LNNAMADSSGDQPDAIPVEHKTQLIDYLAEGCAPAHEFRLGVEQERFIYHGDDLRPAAYEGQRPGIRSLLEGMCRFGWEPVYEDGLVIALRLGDRAITLEPGGQLELSGAPLESVHDTVLESRNHLRQLEELEDELGLQSLALGYQPKWPRSEIPWMPKQRYQIMRAHMPGRGSLGLEMMQCTAAIQLSLDYSSEADMVQKYRTALALQPLATALFANSPFVRGLDSGYLSYRNHVWSKTDADRCDAPEFVFEDDMGFERYTEYLLDSPMYFVIREGRYLDAGGVEFRKFLEGRLAILPGERPTMRDWVDHVSTVFPHVRLKRILEIRGADAGQPTNRAAALAALWTGLLYDPEALNSAWERARQWTPEERQALNAGVSSHGLNTPFRGETVRDLCLWMLDLSREGLQRRGRMNKQGQDESCYLAPLQSVAQTGVTFAEQLLHRFENEWHRNIDIAVRTLCEESSS